MKIAIEDMLTGGVLWSDVDEFVERTSVSWLTHCLACKWGWDLSGEHGFVSDGPCVFVKWGDQ